MYKDRVNVTYVVIYALVIEIRVLWWLLIIWIALAKSVAFISLEFYMVTYRVII